MHVNRLGKLNISERYYFECSSTIRIRPVYWSRLTLLSAYYNTRRPLTTYPHNRAQLERSYCSAPTDAHKIVVRLIILHRYKLKVCVADPRGVAWVSSEGSRGRKTQNIDWCFFINLYLFTKSKVFNWILFGMTNLFVNWFVRLCDE